MDCGGDLGVGEKLLVIEEVSIAKTSKSIVERKNLNICDDRGGEGVRIVVGGKRQSDCGGLNFFSMRDMN